MTDNKNNTESGVESQVDTDAFLDPVLEQYQTPEEQASLEEKLLAAQKERKKTDKSAISAFKRYRDERNNENVGARHYNIFYEVADTKLAALYSNIPKPTVDRRFSDADDHVGRVGGIVLARNLEVENECGNFNGELTNILKDYVIAGMGVGWARLEEESAMQPQPALPQPPLVHPETGAVLHLPPVPQPDVEVKTKQEACIDHVAWDDFFWAPSKTWTLCPWVARRIPMTKQDIEARFAHCCHAQVLAELGYEKNASKDAEKGLQPQNQTEETVDVFELWDKTRKLVFWFAKDAPMPLDVQHDTNEFEGFFPTPLPPLGRFDTSNTQPISDYSLVKGKYAELDELNMRTVSLSRAMGIKFVYDASNEELRDLYTTALENQGVPVKNWNTFMEKGGLAGGINFAPLNEIAAAFAGASEQLDRIKQQIFDLEGISDILRGVATPYETATATTAKMASSFGRFSTKQADVAKYISQLMRLKSHLICKFYEPQIIMGRIGNLQQADQQYIPPALQLLKDEQVRGYRLNVSVDSLQLPNWNTEKAERTSAVTAIFAGIQQVAPVLGQAPELGPFAFAALKWAVAGFKGSEEIQGILDSCLDTFMADQQQKQGQPAQPTPEQIKAQAAQMQAQTTLQVAQMKAQNEQALQQHQQAFQASQAQQEAVLKERQQAIDMGRNQIDAARLQHEVAHDAATQTHNAAIDIQLANKPPKGGA